jgi:hypothetical protein
MLLEGEGHRPFGEPTRGSLGKAVPVMSNASRRRAIGQHLLPKPGLWHKLQPPADQDAGHIGCVWQCSQG